MKNGFIAITNSNWRKVGRKFNLNEVICWMSRQNFTTVQEGGPFFFVEKGKGKRLITGYGSFHKFERCTIKDCWDHNQIRLGAESLDDFLSAIRLPKEPRSLQRQIGCIFVKNVHWLDDTIYIDDCDINFHKATVSGKTISPSEVEIIMKAIENHSVV